MKRILSLRSSLWAVICIWLGLSRLYELPIQGEAPVQKINSSIGLDVFNISLTNSSFLRILGRTPTGISFGLGPISQLIDQPIGAFVERMQQGVVPAARLPTTRTRTTTRCISPHPTPPPLPPVSTVPTAKPVPPLSCTRVQQETVCVNISHKTSCAVSVCCIRPGAASRCVKVSSYSYGGGGTHFRSTTTTTCVSHLSCIGA